MNSKYSMLWVIALFALNQLCHGYLFDYRPSLTDGNLRLAALGGIDLVIIERNSEINAHDFGNSPAGALDDNDYRSEITVPVRYGFTRLGDTSVDHDWHASQIGLNGVYKYMKRFALGGAFIRIDAKDDGTHYSIDGYRRETITLRSVIAAWQTTPRFVIGFEASLSDVFEEDSTFYGAYSNETRVTLFEPSALFNVLPRTLQIGMDYKYKKYAAEFYDTTIVHEFRIPIILASPHLNLGIRIKFGSLPDSGLAREFNIRSFYTVPATDEHLNIGVMCAYQSPMIREDFMFPYQYTYDDGYELTMGFGLAYQVEGGWLLGIQYKKQISAYTEYPPIYSLHNDQVGMGGEIILWDIVPVRMGYVNVSSEYTSGYAVVTWGSGVLVPGIDLELALTHNLYIFKHGYRDETDYDHIFGLAGYLDF